MSEVVTKSFTAKLRGLTSELRALDQSLRANSSASGPVLREFRQALDNIRLTAWTVSELQNAKQIKRDAQAVTSFLNAERLRRFRQMMADFSADLEHNGASWPAQSIDDLQAAANQLRERLGLLSNRRAAKPGDEE
jgi:hypothetical protein